MNMPHFRRDATRRTLAALGLSAAIAVGCLTIAHAQTAPRPLQGDDQSRPPARDGNGYGQEHLYNDSGARAGGRLQRRLDYLRGQLRITVGQERAWDNFADAVEADAQARMRTFARGADRRRDGHERTPVLDRLERRERMLEGERDGLDRMITALRPLYASLTPDQQRVADRELFHPERQRSAMFRHRFQNRDRDRDQDRDQDRDRDNANDHDQADPAPTNQ